MAMNTPYLGNSLSAVSNVNTPMIRTGLTELTSNVSLPGFVDVNSGLTQAELLSYATTASATSAILPDGAFGVYFRSATSARLVYRSGATTYTWIATTGAVL